MFKKIYKAQLSLLRQSALSLLFLATACSGFSAAVFAASGGSASTSNSVTARTTYIVVMKEASLANYSGGVAGYAATSLRASGASKLNANAPESVRYLSYLDGQRTATINDAEALIGHDLDVSYEYGATMVGFAAELTAKEAQQIAALDKVAFIEPEKISILHTDAGPSWSGASGAWGGDSVVLNYVTALSGANEVPAVNSSASGSGTFTYNFLTNELAFSISGTNPDALLFTAMHIHQAPAGSNGGVIHSLVFPATDTDFNVNDSVTLSDIEEKALVNGQLYVNAHSVANPSGEIRGQITLSGTMGEGVVVGVIDTGIDPWNPSFLATGGDGYEHSNPLGTGNYVGVCDSADPAYDPTFPCNDKLIGARSYPSVGAGDARDVDGHGSHTASTAAGNFVFGAEVDLPVGVVSADISGMAPHANIIAYNACCTGAALAAARDQALLDGVDVINYSIGSSAPTGDFWQDSESIQWLALREAGVFVATSNGNNGNGVATTGSPADLPWITSVGANSHFRTYLVTLELTDSDNTTVTVSGQSLTNGYGPAAVVFSNALVDSEDTRLCAPGAFAPGTFNGEIVICERGVYGRVAKGQSVLDGGAGGFVLAQPEEATGGPGSVATDKHELPAVHIDYSEYQKLRQFLLTDAVGSVNGTLSDAVRNENGANGDIMASFSSRGPNGSDADLIVPSVTAPGRAIFAAYHQGAVDGDYTYNIIQGTSMASPHTAGAGALLSVLHPDWTPAEIQSALMMTALAGVLDDDGINTASPFAQGSGHIFVTLATNSPLVMNVTRQEYEAADPDVDNGLEVRDLNIASLGEDNCIGACNWTRTVRNVSAETLSWEIDFIGPPEFVATFSTTSFTLAPGESQQIDVELDVSAAPVFDQWQFGSVQINETSGNYSDSHWPVAVVPVSGNIPETLDIVTPSTSGSVDMDGLFAIGITDLTLDVTGLIQATRNSFTITQDDNLSAGFPDLFFDAGSTTVFVAIDVPADSFSVIAEVVDTSSPDLDILLFLDADANGPDLGDAGDALTNPNACQSASGGSDEFCEIMSPVPGTYYAAVLNYTQAQAGGDLVDLATAVIPVTGTGAGNMAVSGPVSVAAGDPFSLNVQYNEPGMTAIDKLYGYFSVGSSGANPDDLGNVRVSLEYVGIPDIDINPTELTATIDQEATLDETLTLTATGGVLNWNVLSSNGNQAVQDGSFEQGYATNPHWQAGASRFDGQLPICSAATCGSSLATDGDWYLWMGGTTEISAYAQQSITISNGDYAELSFNLLMYFADTENATAALTVSIDGTSVAVFTKDDYPDYIGTSSVAAIDISQYADGGNHMLRFDFENTLTENVNMFIDEVSVVAGFEADRCLGVGSISWLDISPTSGVLSPGQVELDVTFSAAGLAAGTYTDNLCVSSDDPDEPLLSIPLLLNVEFQPAIFKDSFE